MVVRAFRRWTHCGRGALCAMYVLMEVGMAPFLRCAVVAILFVACNTGGTTDTKSCNDTASAPVTGQALGDPCTTATDCAAGRLCGALYLGARPVQQNACTVDCAAVGCPAGSTCVDGQETFATDGGSRRTRFCVPT